MPEKTERIPPISGDMKMIGENIIKFLDRTWDKPTSAIWMYLENQGWTLLIATFSARVKKIEDREPIINKIENLLSFLNPRSKTLFAVTSPANKDLRRLSRILSTGERTIEWKEVPGHLIDIPNIKAAFVYRLSIQDYRGRDAGLLFVKSF